MNEITEKLEKLREAEAIYEQAKTAYRIANAEEVDALNKLNEAQRAFDTAVAAIKKDSPGGDWKHVKRTGDV